MKRAEIVGHIREKQNFLCVGLDPDMEKIPAFLIDNEEDPIYAFNKAIIEATAPFCVSFKPNLAFYEAYGLSGLSSLDKTMRYIKANYPGHFLIADAKRGDIGNTSTMYAKAFFKRLGADAVTINPYMGADSVKPFLSFPDKWGIVLALTSNPGSADFEQLESGGKAIYIHALEKCASWGTPDNLMFVVGATKPAQLAEIRKMMPQHFFLVPGVGAQGGSLEEVCRAGLNSEVGLLVNASRSILYAGDGINFAEAAGEEAKRLAAEMKKILTQSPITTN
jgi:orotidine-5'-phosphate decarboxylase